MLKALFSMNLPRWATRTSLSWLLLYGAIALAWLGLYLMQLPDDGFTQAFGKDFWRSICVSQISFFNLFFMWTLMSGAMMAPTALPMLATYDDLRHAGAGTIAGFWGLLAGYLLVWFGFSLAAAAAQQWLFEARLLNINGQSTSPALSAGLLALAGLYQFSNLKDACLTACRAPLLTFIGKEQAGLADAFMHGLREGLACLGCCWALMLLAFVGGTMNLVFMGLAMVLMLVEKLPQLGTYVTRPLGSVLLAASPLVLIF